MSDVRRSKEKRARADLKDDLFLPIGSRQDFCPLTSKIKRTNCLCSKCEYVDMSRPRRGGPSAGDKGVALI